MEYYSAHSDEIMGDHDIHFDDERPPTYNAEDYAAHLKKYSSLPGHCQAIGNSRSTKIRNYHNSRPPKSGSKKNYQFSSAVQNCLSASKQVKS